MSKGNRHLASLSPLRISKGVLKTYSTRRPPGFSSKCKSCPFKLTIVEVDQFNPQWPLDRSFLLQRSFPVLKNITTNVFPCCFVNIPDFHSHNIVFQQRPRGYSRLEVKIDTINFSPFLSQKMYGESLSWRTSEDFFWQVETSDGNTKAALASYRK